jgi:hypothetical protein
MWIFKIFIPLLIFISIFMIFFSIFIWYSPCFFDLFWRYEKSFFRLLLSWRIVYIFIRLFFWFIWFLPLWLMALWLKSIWHLWKYSILRSISLIVYFTAGFIDIAKGIFLYAKTCDKKIYTTKCNFLNSLLFIIYRHS